MKSRLARNGRIMLRRTEGKHTALIGLLQFADTVAIDQTMCYPAIINPNSLQLFAAPLDIPMPRRSESWGINVNLREKIWPSLRGADLVSFRVVDAFPAQNAWTVYGASDKLIIGPDGAIITGDEWFDIVDGVLVRIDPPISTHGLQPSQLLDAPVWPHEGELYSLPQHPRAIREAYFQMSKLQARCGAGEFDIEELVRRLRAEPALEDIRPWSSPDANYLRWLAEMDKRGALTLRGPVAAKAFGEVERIADEVLRESLDNHSQ